MLLNPPLPSYASPTNPSQAKKFVRMAALVIEENDIEEQWQEQQQKRDGATRPHVASVHDLR